MLFDRQAGHLTASPTPHKHTHPLPKRGEGIITCTTYKYLQDCKHQVLLKKEILQILTEHKSCIPLVKLNVLSRHVYIYFELLYIPTKRDNEGNTCQ